MANDPRYLNQDPYAMGPPAQDPGIDYKTGADFVSRLKMSFAANPEMKRRVLEQKYGIDNVGLITAQDHPNYGELVYRKDPKSQIIMADEDGLDWSDLADIAGDVPEIAGQIAGGVGGYIVGNAPGGFAGAAAGGAVGKGVKQIGAAIMGVPDERTAGDRSLDMAKAAGRGLAGEALGIGVAKGANKMLGPMRGSMAPESRALVEEADMIGMPYTPADVTKNRNMAIVESGLDNLVGSAGQMQRVRGRQLEKLGGLQDELLQAGGGRMDATLAGESAQKGLKSISDVFKSQAGQMYDEVEKLAAGKMVPVNNLRSAVDVLSTKNVYGTLPSDLRSLLKRIQSRVEESVDIKPSRILNDRGQPASIGRKQTLIKDQTFNDLRELRSELGRLGSSQEAIAQKKEGMYKYLRKALEKDLNEWAQSEGSVVWSKMQQANGYYRISSLPLGKIGIGDFRSQVGKKLSNEQNPAALVKYIFKPNNAKNILRVRALVGQEGFQDLKQAFLTDLLEDASGSFMAQGNKEITFPRLAKLDRFFQKYDTNTLKLIFSPQELQKLSQLHRMAKFANTAQRMAGNPSGTAQVGMAGSAIMRLMDPRIWQGAVMGGAGVAGGGVGLAAGSAGAVGLPWAMAKAILSKPGVKYLTTGKAMPKALEHTVHGGFMPVGSTGARGFMGYDKTGVK